MPITSTFYNPSSPTRKLQEFTWPKALSIGVSKHLCWAPSKAYLAWRRVYKVLYASLAKGQKKKWPCITSQRHWCWTPSKGQKKKWACITSQRHLCWSPSKVYLAWRRVYRASTHSLQRAKKKKGHVSPPIPNYVGPLPKPIWPILALKGFKYLPMQEVLEPLRAL